MLFHLSYIFLTFTNSNTYGSSKASFLHRAGAVYVHILQAPPIWRSIFFVSPIYSYLITSLFFYQAPVHLVKTLDAVYVHILQAPPMVYLFRSPTLHCSMFIFIRIRYRIQRRVIYVFFYLLNTYTNQYLYNFLVLSTIFILISVFFVNILFLIQFLLLTCYSLHSCEFGPYAGTPLLVWSGRVPTTTFCEGPSRPPGSSIYYPLPLIQSRTIII